MPVLSFILILMHNYVILPLKKSLEINYIIFVFLIQIIKSLLKTKNAVIQFTTNDRTNDRTIRNCI